VILILLLLACETNQDFEENKPIVIAVEEQAHEVEKLKAQISKTSKKLDCIPQIIEKNVSEDCKKLIKLKR